METTAIQSMTPLWAVVVAVVAAAGIFLSRDRPNPREGCSLLAAGIQFLLVFSMLPAVLSGHTLHYTLFEFLPQVALAFRVDALGLFLALTASFLWLLTTIFSIGYMRALEEHAQTRFYACFAITLAATLAVAFSANLVTVYIFYELLTLATYPLVTHRGSDEAMAAGKKYLLYHLGTSIVFLLPALILTYGVSGTFDFRPGGVFAGNSDSALLYIIYFLFLAGSAKAAVMPFHNWLPSAMVAPVPVSALLHAVAVVNVGVFVILRVIFDVVVPDLMRMLDLGIITAYIASFTILFAGFYAYRLDNLKGVLAYSTIGQLSYIVLGAAMLTAPGMTGGIIHIANHAFSKITLFFCAGAIYVATRKTNVSELSGIGWRMPLTMGAFTIGALSIIGVPTTAGFITKWFVLLGSLEAELYPVFIVLLISTLLSAVYFLKIIRRAFFDAEALPEGALADPPRRRQVKAEPSMDPSLFLLVPLLLTAFVTMVLGIYPTATLELARQILR
jgi:multicomponent Na+:H+ antiporter subunit D